MMNFIENSEDKLDKLKQELKSFETVAIAFSGGVDSTFLLKISSEVLGEKAIAITARGAAFSGGEMEEADEFCRIHGIRHLKVDIGGDDMETFSHNPPDRCYICKKMIFGKLRDEAYRQGIAIVADGTNLSDDSDYRPGMRALAELGIKSPLSEAGLTKDDIRAYLKEMGLTIWNKPAYACLASRIPYGEVITAEKLKQIDTVEGALRQLGFSQVRVRHHGNVARIEVLPEDRAGFFDIDIMDQVNDIVKASGFAYGALDLGGYSTGSLNKVLQRKEGDK